jgi:hypothetical protein
VSAVSAPYHPGQSPWPDNQSQRPDRPPPIQFRPEDQEPRGNPWLAWTLRIVGLIAVAAISGVVWWYIQHEGPKGNAAGDDDGNSQQQSEGVYDFTPKLDEPKVDTSCSDHAYDKVKAFLQSTPCDRLIRDIFTTEVEGRKVYASVSVVRMADASAAEQLRQLTDQDGTGNVKDLVRESVVRVDGLTSLSKGGGYESAQHGKEVVIVEADYDPAAAKGGSEKELEDVCRYAVPLGAGMVAKSG